MDDSFGAILDFLQALALYGIIVSAIAEGLVSADSSTMQFAGLLLVLIASRSVMRFLNSDPVISLLGVVQERFPALR